MAPLTAPRSTDLPHKTRRLPTSNRHSPSLSISLWGGVRARQAGTQHSGGAEARRDASGGLPVHSLLGCRKYEQQGD